MFGQHFYHKSIRNTVIAFGTIFNNINIRRLDSSGNPLQKIRVPLSYAPKEKFIARLDQNANLTGDDSSVAITLPRMSFDVTGYAYDASRKLNKNQRHSVAKNASGDEKKVYTQYSPVPYDVSFELNVFTATSDDGLQVIEQILPYFQPDYTVTMIIDKDYMDTKRDIPFILESVDYEDSYQGALTDRRRIIYTLKIYCKNISIWSNRIKCNHKKSHLPIYMIMCQVQDHLVVKELQLHLILQVLIKMMSIHTQKR